VSYLLRQAGAEVEIAGDGLAVVEAGRGSQASGRQFDVILMDIHMPLLDGYDATRSLRGAGYSRPIIALTAGTMAGDRDHCMRAGCDDNMSKPVDRDLLIAMCREWADRGRMRRTG
jgi:CheY-like chemotaxis protein